MNSSIRQIILAMVVTASLAFFPVPPIFGNDMRAVQIQAEQAREALRQKAAAELAAAEKKAQESRLRIQEDREAMQAAITALQQQTNALRKEVDQLGKEGEQLQSEETDLTRKLSESDNMIRELVGVIRINAKDIGTLVTDNLQTAVLGTDTGFLDAIAGQSLFPGMKDIQTMVSILFDQIRQSGSVSLQQAPMVDRTGRQVESKVLLIGCFTAAYNTETETGFLNYAPTGRKLYALSRLPDSGMQKQIRQYMKGAQEAVPMDISRGGALRQLTHELRLWEQVPKGGPIVWPILAILVIGIIIVAERTIFLVRKRINADPIVEQIERSAASQEWEECSRTCLPYSKSPVIRVVQAGLGCRDLPREEMETVLQEAILKEIPPMEKFLSTLGMLAAIAPLLGLLGTVTGMIDTFHVITQYGTGDPRMMSGGISEALVTTMLGLTVAIPIMLAHTLLGRTMENTIGEMEEKAVALVNIVQKYRGD